MALENLVQQSLAADGFHAALIGSPQHIVDGLAAVADDLNITVQHQLPSLTVEGEGERSARINNSSAILFERCPDAYLTPFSVEGFGERHHDAGVFAPAFSAAVSALLGAVVVQQNDAANEWLVNDLAEVSEQFTARKIVFMAPASRARDALHAVGEHRGDALLLDEGSELDDPVDVRAPGSLTLARVMPPDMDALGTMAGLQNRIIRIDTKVVAGFLQRPEPLISRDEQDFPRLASIAAIQEGFAKRNRPRQGQCCCGFAGAVRRVPMGNVALR